MGGLPVNAAELQLKLNNAQGIIGLTGLMDIEVPERVEDLIDLIKTACDEALKSNEERAEETRPRASQG